MNSGADIQVVDGNAIRARCKICGHVIMEIGTVEFLEKTCNYSDHRMDLYRCIECGAVFWMRFNVCDAEGHILQSVFCSDINDPEDTWQSVWTKEQLATIEKHLAGCQICKDRLNEEMCSDAWFAELIHGNKKY